MRPERRVDLAWSTLLALAVTGPLLLGGGYWLVGDMVFVPQQPWKSAWLGLDGSLPRAVPMDALISLLTQVVPGWVVQRVFLVGALLLGGMGISRLVRDRAWYARAAAISVFVWNPWVHDRLQMGQWAILSGYLALPWVALAARRFRTDPRTGWAPVALALTVSALCSPSSGVMAVLVLAVLGLRRSWTSWVVLAGLSLVANLPWLLPSLVARSSSVTTDAVFDLFAPRAESSLGTLASLISMGGTWKSSIVAGERSSVVVIILAGALTAVALLGAWRLQRDASTPDARAEVRRLAVVAAGALVLAAVPALGGAELLSRLGERAPGVALLRDAQRFLAPAGLLLAVGVASAVTWTRARVAPGRESAWAVVALLVIAPVLLLPSLAWGAGGLQRSSYPADWDAVAERLAAEQAIGPEQGSAMGTIVLPWAGSYRTFDWADGRAMLDPAPRYFPGDVLIDDRTFVDGAEIASEDPRVQRVARALEAGSPSEAAAALEAQGIRWVVVEKGQLEQEVPAGTVVLDGPVLALVDLSPGGRAASLTGVDPTRSNYSGLVISGHLWAISLLIASGAYILRSGRRRRQC